MTVTEVAASGKHAATVIFLHGLGDSGTSWVQPAKFLAQPHIKFLLPSAPFRPVSINGGERMPAWFDRKASKLRSWFDDKGLDWNSEVDQKGLAESTAFVHSLIDKEAKLLGSASRVLVAGFSQGGALALHSTLTYPQRLSATAVLSSFVVDSKVKVLSANKETPVFLAHGDKDPLVSVSLSTKTQAFLDEFNPNVELHVYKGLDHSTTAEEMRDLKDFLLKHLPA